MQENNADSTDPLEPAPKQPEPDAVPSELQRKEYGTRQRIGLLVGAVFFFGMLVLPTPWGLEAAAWRAAAVAALMGTWWITEAIPIPATALLPLVLFPILQIGSIGEATTPYANPLIFLFMGGFMIALAMQACNLHRRVALTIVSRVGLRPSSIIAGFMVASALLSMWVSNTATALMMLPIGLSIVGLVSGEETETGDAQRNFGVVLVLCIAYACNIGGLGTLIGTPPNALVAAYMLETYGVEIGFAQWMMMGLPLVIVSLPLAFLVLTRLFPIDARVVSGGASAIQSEVRRLGKMSGAERKVAWVFMATALLWMTRPLLGSIIPGLTDAGIAMAATIALFLIPDDWRQGRFLLTWRKAEALPWGVLILFGGGLSLAGAITRTGLAEAIGGAVSTLGHWPLLLVLLTTVTIIILLTEITSNTATAAAFLPILGSVAIGIGENPLLLVIPAAVAASCAFMLPVATPPNAIVYGSGRVAIPEMARAGVWLNILFIGLITLMGYTLLLLAFDVDLGVLPEWVSGG